MLPTILRLHYSVPESYIVYRIILLRMRRAYLDVSDAAQSWLPGLWNDRFQFSAGSVRLSHYYMHGHVMVVFIGLECRIIVRVPRGGGGETARDTE